MDGLSDLRIKKMIVHQVDQESGSSAALSDFETPVSLEVSAFLSQHIVKSHEHKYARNARFVAPEDGVVSLCDISRSILEDPTLHFVDGSKAIANHLYSIVSRDRRISPSDLVICLCERQSRLELAILKMDPEDGFVGQREKFQGGFRIILEKVENVLPTTALQKSAFILPQTDVLTGHDLRVLDHQVTRHGLARTAASFFLSDFLQCQVDLNKQDQTNTFYHKSMTWLDHNAEAWSETDQTRFRERISACLTEVVVSVSSIADATIINSDEKADYLQTISDSGVDLTFEPDQVLGRKFLKYRYFEGDRGLKIRIQSDAVGSGQTVEIGEKPPFGNRTITISTLKWEEVSK